MGDTRYICAECGAVAHAEPAQIDSGTAWTCDNCGGQTTVLLCTRREYRKNANAQPVLNMYEDAVEAALGKFESEHVDKDLGDGRCGPEYVCDICYQYAPKLQNIPHRNSCPLRMLREALAAHRELEAGE